MKRIALAALISAFALGAALAQTPTPAPAPAPAATPPAADSCDAKVADIKKKNGNPISGAAKTAALKKCKREACEPKAVSSEGKKLAGAAKRSFMTKCEAGA
jgi:hypothetical protein